MIIRNRPRKKPKYFQVEMAVRAVEANYSASEPAMGGFDPSPIALDLDYREEAETCPNPRRTRPAQGMCSECGQPLHGDCA
jgi:hypothetical protein